MNPMSRASSTDSVSSGLRSLTYELLDELPDELPQAIAAMVAKAAMVPSRAELRKLESFECMNSDLTRG